MVRARGGRGRGARYCSGRGAARGVARDILVDVTRSDDSTAGGFACLNYFCIYDYVIHGR